MQAFYTAKDDKGNAAGNLLGTALLALPLTQGETKLVTVFLFLSNGLPLVIPGTISTAVVKVFSSINQASIQKTLAGATLTLIALTGISGTIGFQFQLSAADTASMAANNSGLPMIATFTDSLGNVTELDFQSMFNVAVAAVLT